MPDLVKWIPEPIHSYIYQYKPETLAVMILVILLLLGRRKRKP